MRDGEGSAAEELAAMRAELQARCQVPPLPPGWWWSSAMIAAEGLDYGGDFFVAQLLELPDGPGLQMVLVDVCRHGDSALPDASHLAQTLQELVAEVPHADLMPAVNAHLTTSGDPESFATAAQVVLCFATGRYEIRSAGHPPVLRWSRPEERWLVDSARGTALGVLDTPELQHSTGTLAPGEALMFYTDGVVETRTEGIDVGIDWLRATAGRELDGGWETLAHRVLARVLPGADDRAILLLGRSGI